MTFSFQIQKYLDITNKKFELEIFISIRYVGSAQRFGNKDKLLS